MKYLTIIRHARAAKGSEAVSDLERPLTEEGVRKAVSLGHLLAAKQLRPESILSSPAARAMATAEAVAAQLGIHPAKIRKDERLYSQDVGEILRLIREIPDRLREVCLVGHNPTALDLINTLADRPMGSLPAGVAVRMELAVERWSDTRPLCAKVLWQLPDRVE